MADIDAALEQNVLDLAQRQRIPDIHHHRQADDFGRRVEITEQISHPQRLRTGLASLKPIWSDSAQPRTLTHQARDRGGVTLSHQAGRR